MSLPLATLAIIVIWSTTPLAVKWSAEEAGFLFAVLSRMFIAAVICQIIVTAIAGKWIFHKRALLMYLLSGFNIYFSMTLIYWASEIVSSGLIALLFGLMPIITGIFASIILKEKSLTVPRLMGIAIAFSGLLLIFNADHNTSEHYVLAVIAIVSAVTWHSLGTVLLKRFSNDMPIMSLTTGGIWVSTGLLSLHWLISGSALPENVSAIGWSAILYLSIVATVIGFTVYFYLLKNIEASKIALIPLVTPVCAMLLGKFLNNEQADAEVWFGALLILTGLSFYQVSHYLIKQMKVIKLL